MPAPMSLSENGSSPTNANRPGATGGHREWGLCAPFVEQLPISGASISVVGARGSQSTVCVSDPIAERLDQLQFDLGEGPRWELLRTGEPVVCSDVQIKPLPQWPVFGAAAAALGVGALFAFPIMMGAVRVGAVDLYRTAPGPLSRDALHRVSTLARIVATRSVDATIRSAGDADAAALAQSPALHREVHQATGMILVQMATTATSAFSLLRAHAFARGRTIDAVARDVLTGAIDFRQLSDEI